MRFGRVFIHPAFFLTLFSFLLAENSIYAVAVLFCAAFHELGHIAAIYMLGSSVGSFSLLPFGAKLRLSRDVGYKKEAVIALSGPLAGVFLCILLLPLAYIFDSAFIYFCGVCSLWLSVFNLVPVGGFDGAQIVKCALFCAFPYEKALGLVKASELAALILLSALATASVILSSYNLSLCAICILLFFSAFGFDC